MPEIMQLGPDDNDIDPYLTPCPADYPPCPLCGEHPDMLESGHIICCNILVNNTDAWFLLPRALTWTHEPPQVAGWYWRKETAKDRAHVFHFTGNWEDYGEHWESDRVCQLPLNLNGNLWAGPISPPID